jgi:hypothetical protein
MRNDVENTLGVMNLHLHFVALLSLACAAFSAAAEVEFEGVPSVKVEVYEGAAQTQAVPSARAREFSVRIVRSGNTYLWASRNNVPLVKQESGAYVTYVATTGAGYVRVLSPSMRNALAAIAPERREKEFVYVEHMVNQLGSVTYFGK